MKLARLCSLVLKNEISDFTALTVRTAFRYGFLRIPETVKPPNSLLPNHLGAMRFAATREVYREVSEKSSEVGFLIAKSPYKSKYYSEFP